MKLTVLAHPIVGHKLAILRDKKTGTKEFREIISELATILCYEATKDVKTFETEIETPMTKTKAKKINENDFIFLPILRAGIGMVDGILKFIPNAKIGHVGLYRNEETLKPVTYYFKVTNKIEEKEVIVLDPMLATGGSACDTFSKIKEKGVTKIKFLCIIAAPEGIEKIKKEHPDVEVYAAAVDSCLNDIGYIMPGLGDAGDRIFGTK